ncbi:MAG: exosome complex protein Rrp42 [Nitrososphaeria archaeon]
MMPRKNLLVSAIRREQILKSLAQGKRVDGRGLLDYRPLTITPNIIEKAEGSAYVKLGETQVVAGVKIGLGSPFPDTPNEGILIVNAEILPTASEYQEPGPPDEDAIELARVVDRGIRESKMIDFTKLAVEPGKHVHVVYVDISVVGMDGNLFDAASYAAVTALLTTRFYPYVLQDGSLTRAAEKTGLPVQDLAVSTTFAKIENYIVVDPTWEEESIMDARLTVVYDRSGNICAMQKGGSGGILVDEVFSIVDLAKSKSEEMRKVLERVVQDAGSRS